MTRIQVILSLSSVFFLLVIIQLTRRRKIRVQYALVWFLCGLILLFFSLFKELLDLLARALGIFYAPSLILVVLVFLGLILSIHFSIVISRLNEDNRRLSQELGLLKKRLDEVEKEKKT